ncbi:DNA repair protein RadC [Vibrio parahaemolyticus]|nr:DNA repair protein RadC [Vibrio parahaemolyticus]
MKYPSQITARERKVLEEASAIMESFFHRGYMKFTETQHAKDFFSHYLAGLESEHFAVAWLDSQHNLLGHEILFTGTVDAASVYPREVVKKALGINAAAVVFAHNHPSGEPNPSQADRHITKRLQDALALIDVRVLDHIIVGETASSFAQMGYIG